MGELFSNLGINGKLLFAQVVNFLIIFVLLAKFVYPKLIAFTEKRKQRIEEGLVLTEKAEREMLRINEARGRELEKARKEADSVIARGKSAGEEKEHEIISAAKDQAEYIAKLAKEQAEVKDVMKKFLRQLMGKEVDAEVVKEEKKAVTKKKTAASKEKKAVAKERPSADKASLDDITNLFK